MNHVVPIAELTVSRDPDDVLVTYSLGSCVGVTLFDPIARVGGLAHCMLPLRRDSDAGESSKRCRFTDSGVTQLLRAVFDLGARRERLIVKVAGASSLLDERGLFRIGERNEAIVRKVLWRNRILISAQDTGGLRPRTMRLYLRDGRTTIQSTDREFEL